MGVGNTFWKRTIPRIRQMLDIPLVGASPHLIGCLRLLEDIYNELGGKVISDSETKFWRRVGVSGEHWLWRGAVSDGKLKFRWQGVLRLASHVAWEVSNGVTLPKYTRLMRVCNVELCVAPLHHRAIEPGGAVPRLRDEWPPPGLPQVHTLPDRRPKLAEPQLAEPEPGRGHAWRDSPILLPPDVVERRLAPELAEPESRPLGLSEPDLNDVLAEFLNRR